MKKSKRFLAAGVALVLVGCASHLAIAPLGGDRFMLSKQASTGFPGLGSMKAELIQEGGAHCIKAGKEFRLLDSQETKPPYIFGNYPRSEITFACK